MKVLVLSHYFWPEPIPKPLELAQALREEGHAVHAVTGFPNYPDGTLYPGFALRLVRRDVVAGIPVIRTFMYPSHGTSLFGRMLNYASFMVSSVWGALLAGPFDVMYVWHPPLSIGVAAAAIAALRRRRFVYDVQDIWPESALATGFLRPGRMVSWMARLERFVYRRAGHLLVVTEGARANLVSKGVPEDRISVAPHWYDDREIRQVPPGARNEVRAREGWSHTFILMFAGNMGLLQGLETVVRACAELPDDGSLRVVMVGEGVDLSRLKALSAELSLDRRIQFVARQDAASMARYYSAADGLLVHLQASPVAPLTIPSKTVAYLAAGKPILLAGIGASADIITDAGAGLAVPPDDPQRLAEAMLALAATPMPERVRMGQRGRQYFEQHFTREAALPIYVDALKRCAAGRGSAA